MNAAGCVEIRPEILKGMHQEVLWLTRAWQVARRPNKVHATKVALRFLKGRVAVCVINV